MSSSRRRRSETGTLTRGGNLVLASGAGQAGAGPGVGLLNGFGPIGVPVNFAFGLNDTLELGGGFTSFLTPAPWDQQFGTWLQGMFVSNLTLYGRFSVVPKKFAIAPKIVFGGPFIDSTILRPALLQADSQFTTAFSDSVRLYWVNNLTMVLGLGFQTQLQSSGTFMFTLTDLFYAQALVGTGTGFAIGNGGSSSALVPWVSYPIQVGTGGGIVTGENEGIGVAFQMGFAQPLQLEGFSTGPVTNAGLVATYVKAI